MDTPVFVVVGGSRGIGAAISRAAAGQGMQVLFTYSTHAADAEALLARIRAEGGRAEALRADAASEADLAAAFQAADRLGRLAVLVYNSGITGAPSPLAEASTEAIDRVLDVNLRGALLSAREAVRRMSTRRGGSGGSIVFISSRAAFYGSPNEFVWYAASKGGMDSLTSGLAREVGPEGIRVNAVSPGPIATDIHQPGKLEQSAKRAPLQRAGAPEEVASTVLFLASPAASYVTGANLIVAGGL